MDFCKITAFFPPGELENVEAELKALHVPGMTVSRAHGFGTYRNYYANDIMVDSMRVEIFTPREGSDEIVQTLSRAIRDVANCDGMIAVTPVEKVIRVQRFSGDAS